MNDEYRRRLQFAVRRKKSHPEANPQPKIKTGIVMKNLLGPNWKTTQAGIAMLGAGLALIGTALKDGAQLSDLQSLVEAVAAISGGMGLIFARDRNVTSEESNAK